MKNAPGNFIKAVIFSLVPAVFFFAAAELGLRLFRFQYSNTPLEMRLALLRQEGAARLFTETENAGVIRYIKDSKQLWVPAEPFAPGISKQKRAGVTRIAALGCSCTAGCVAMEGDTVDRLNNGWTNKLSYPAMLGQEFEKVRPGKFEVINAGVGGHSSFQGLQRFKETVLPYQPDILLVYFGWNDHWIAPQDDKNAKIADERLVPVINFLENFRVYQFLHFAVDKAKNKTLEKKNAPLQPRFRVSPEDYRSNLEAIIKLAGEKKIKVFLFTAPSDFSGFKPDPSIFPFDRNMITNVHAAYNQIVKEVGEKNNVRVIDLAEYVPDAEKKGQKIISADGIHLWSSGCRWLAKNLADEILAELKV